jgi:glycosyltransferase involved in cell wall biosynthesis
MTARVLWLHMIKESKPHRVCHVINNLRTGGAQTMLTKLLSQLDASRWENHVIALIENQTPLADQIQERGIPVVSAGLPHGLPTVRGALRLVRTIRQINPDVVQTWLFHSDLLGGLAAKWVSRSLPVAWNIRRAALVKGVDRRTTFLTAAICARLSHRLPNRVIVNSHDGCTQHTANGYCEERMCVIPNGFDKNRFVESLTEKERIRRELQLSEKSLLVGLVGRYHAQKDHCGFLDAARLILSELPDTHFLLCGNDITQDNAELWRNVKATDASSHFHLLGCRQDMPSIQASLDLATLSSVDEGFPNAIGEAMACGVPCVVTDVGGSGELVGGTGQVIPPRDPSAFAHACLSILRMSAPDRQRLGQQARRRIVDHFSLDIVAQHYTDLWDQMIAESSAGCRPSECQRVTPPHQVRRVA